MTGRDLSRAVWNTSSYSSQDGNCVEVATNIHGVVGVRDSKDPDSAELVVSRAAWTAFLRDLKGQYPGS